MSANGQNLTPVSVDLLPPTYRRARLSEPLNAYGYHVPVGFETDFTSIPRIFWRVLPPWSWYSPAAILHDWLYLVNGLTRKQTDDLFKEHIKALRLQYLKAMSTGDSESGDYSRIRLFAMRARRAAQTKAVPQLIYRGVRLGGWRAWGRYRKAEAKAASKKK